MLQIRPSAVCRVGILTFKKSLIVIDPKRNLIAFSDKIIRNLIFDFTFFFKLLIALLVAGCVCASLKRIYKKVFPTRSNTIPIAQSENN